MLDLLKTPDRVKIICEGVSEDAAVRFVREDGKLRVFLTAQRDEPRFVCLRWEQKTTAPVQVLGDCWERSYCDLAWLPLDPTRFMPWYFMVKSDEGITGCGVAVQPNSMVSFEYDASGVTAWLDVRCGAVGVRLAGRELELAAFVCEHYGGISAFEATKRFCRVMCPSPRLPKTPVYGGNNWYYAYGTSSDADILQDAALVAELAEGLSNRPFMVIDSCWEINHLQNRGPWLPNERFADMTALTGKMRGKGVRPGIWFRPLYDKEFAEQHPECCMKRAGGEVYADPSHPETQAYLREVVRRLRGWGFELIKHDFTTVDMFGDYGWALNGAVTKQQDWSFYDRSKTSAEIVLDLYRLLREEAGDAILLSCNTLSHLCAGLTELNRIGDDTSGLVWDRTMDMGVNTLAFRLPQHNVFYAVDADVVGIYENHIPWELNRQWAELLTASGAPFFASCQPAQMDAEKKQVIREAFRHAAEANDTAIPLDWEYNKLPCRWCLNGKETVFDWQKNYVPALIERELVPVQPEDNIAAGEPDFSF